MPNLHAMMRESVTFDRAYTCNAICSPARASLLTGTLPHVHGMVDCTHTVPSYRADYDASLDTLTGVLHEEGYHVSYFGKWHIERTHKLEKFGIDNYETEIHIPSFKVTMKDKVMTHKDDYADKMVCGIFEESAEHTEEHYIYEKALADIEANRDSGKPFCTFISTYAPHDPYVVPQEIYDLYDGKNIALPRSFDDSMMDKPVIYRRMREALSDLTPDDFRKAMRCYFSYCTLVDKQIGKLAEYLKEKDLYDDTIIVCMSDHGDMQGAHGMMMKSIPCFEEIYRIPLVMKLPQQAQGGKHVDFYMSTCEVAPTLLELAGCRALTNRLASKSMVPYLNGERTDKHYAFAEFFGQRYAWTQRIYWENNLKYVFNAFAEDELYDLANDPDELMNVSEHPAYQQKKNDLCRKMWECIKGTEDTTLMDAEYFLLRIAPVGPGEKKKSGDYSLYNKSF